MYVLSLATAVLMAVASVAGLLYPDQLYPADALRESFVPTDATNLLIGLPFLIGSLAFARRGHLLSLLFWPGALLYVLYNYIVYAFALPLNAGLMLALVLLVLSVYTVIGLVASIDGRAVQDRLAGAVPERLAGGVLAGLGLLFFLRVAGLLLQALAGGTPLAEAELAAMVADLMLTPAWVIGGIALWRRQALGYVSAAGLLFQASMLFVGLVFFLLLQPLLTDAPFLLTDVVVVLILGLISFVPFALFVRGVVSRR
jgi:hypothetical protein